jgi:hypothetical protein
VLFRLYRRRLYRIAVSPGHASYANFIRAKRETRQRQKRQYNLECPHFLSPFCINLRRHPKYRHNFYNAYALTFLLITAANLFIAAIANLPITVMKRKRAAVNRRDFCVWRTDKIAAIFVISRPTRKNQNSICRAADTETMTKLIKKLAPSFSTIHRLPCLTATKPAKEPASP